MRDSPISFGCLGRQDVRVDFVFRALRRIEPGDDQKDYLWIMLVSVV